MSPRDGEPKERGETLRRALARALRAGPRTAHELSAEVRVAEREVAAHLEHLERSLAATGEELVVEPAVCKGCGYRFEQRGRFGRPSRCPKCKSERLSAPRFSLQPKA